jgi:hypothetical protein
VLPPGTANERGGGSGEDEELYDESDGSGDGNGSQQALSYKSFVLDAVTGLSLSDTDTNAKGKTVATLTVPEEGGPWTPELVEDAEDNALFEIVETGDGTYEIQIKDGALPPNSYKVVIEIRNEAAKVFNRTFVFSVAATPPPFGKEPQVQPYITIPGKNKLVVEWDEHPRTATWVQPYVGTTSDSKDAKPYGNHIPVDDKTVEITDLEWDTTDGFLPDSTTYYVWLRPGNDSTGMGMFSPTATTITSDPIDPRWWTDIDWWDVIDSYEFFFNDKGELVIGYSTRSLNSNREGFFTSSNVDEQCWVVRHHVSFDPQELNSKVPNTKIGHYTTKEDLTGAPAGVFIVETPETKHKAAPFYAVFYWGFWTIQTGNATGTPTHGPHAGQTVSLKGTIHAYLSNAWNGGGGYQATLKKAIQWYVGNNRKVGIWSWVAFVATGWYPVKDGQYKYGKPVP